MIGRLNAYDVPGLLRVKFWGPVLHPRSPVLTHADSGRSRCEDHLDPLGQHFFSWAPSDLQGLRPSFLSCLCQDLCSKDAINMVSVEDQPGELTGERYSVPPPPEL